MKFYFLGTNLFWKKKILHRYQSYSVLVHFRRKKLFWKKKILKNHQCYVDNFVVEYLTELLVNLREKII